MEPRDRWTDVAGELVFFREWEGPAGLTFVCPHGLAGTRQNQMRLHRRDDGRADGSHPARSREHAYESRGRTHPMPSTAQVCVPVTAYPAAPSTKSHNLSPRAGVRG